MMDSLKQRIVDYVSANQPVRRGDLRTAIGISGKALDREVSTLKSLGLMFAKVGYGYFSSELDYLEWRVGAGADQVQGRAMKGAIARHESKNTYPSRVVELLSRGGKFGGADIAKAIGASYKQISTAISMLVRTGEIQHSGARGSRVYSIGTPKKGKSIRSNSVNTIFQECRNSDAMKRVLMVWGRAPA